MPVERRRTKRPTLRAFLRLAGRPDAVAVFAAEYGSLGLCEAHGWPAPHGSTLQPDGADIYPAPSSFPCLPAPNGDKPEDVAAWASEANALREVASATRATRARPEPATTYLQRRIAVTGDLRPTPLSDYETPRGLIDAAVNRWAVMARIRPRLGRSWRVEWSAPGTFGAVALALLADISAARSITGRPCMYVGPDGDDCEQLAVRGKHVLLCERHEGERERLRQTRYRELHPGYYARSAREARRKPSSQP